VKYVESLFFGSSDHLFGMYHPAISQRRNHGVVICAPLFHEFYRSHFAIRRIAIELAQKGYDVLRFDYSGTGDSKGGIPADMFNVWSDEIGAAMTEIRHLSGCSAVTLITSRFSGSLGVPWQSSANRNLRWDPIPGYEDYMKQLDATHAALLAEHVTMSSSETARHTENDYLGTGQSREYVSEMLAAFLTRADVQLQEVNSAKLVEIQSDLDWVSASLKTIYAHDTVSQISAAM
jgi:predicted alpha/beta hydrolase